VIHVAAGLLILAMTCVVLVLVSLVVPGAPEVDGFFVTGTCAALVTSSAFLWYVRKARL